MRSSATTTALTAAAAGRRDRGDRERPLRRVSVSQRGTGHRRHLTKLQAVCALPPGGTTHLSGTVTGEKRETREKRDDAGAGHGVRTSRRPEWVTSRCRTVTVHEPRPPTGLAREALQRDTPAQAPRKHLVPPTAFSQRGTSPARPAALAAPRAGAVSRNSAQRGGAAPPRTNPGVCAWHRPALTSDDSRQGAGGLCLLRARPAWAGLGWAGHGTSFLFPLGRPAPSRATVPWGNGGGRGAAGGRDLRGGGTAQHSTVSESRRCLPAAILRPSASSATCAGRRRALPGPGRAGRLSLTGCVFSPQGPRRPLLSLGRPGGCPRWCWAPRRR